MSGQRRKPGAKGEKAVETAPRRPATRIRQRAARKAATGINIKNPETVRLVRQLAELTNEGQTAAVTKAVEARLKEVLREKNTGMAERIMKLAHEIHQELGGGPAPDIDALLYDPETGLPRED